MDVRPPDAVAAGAWTEGTFTPYVIGDPGRAASQVVPRSGVEWPWMHDTVIDGMTLNDAADRPALVVRATSVRGLSHRYSGKVRQDDYAVVTSAGGRYLIAAVADGVSSGPESHTAARLAVWEGVTDLAASIEARTPDGYDWHGLMHHLAALMEEGVRRGRGPDAEPALTRREVANRMAATVVYGVVELAPGDDGDRRAWTVRLGDTSAWVVRRGAWVPLGEVKNDGAVIAESATRALPLVPETPPEVAVTVLAPGDVFVLMSDGVGDPLGTGNGEVGAVLARAWETPPPPLQFAAQVDFARKSFDDDRTAVAVWAGEA